MEQKYYERLFHSEKRTEAKNTTINQLTLLLDKHINVGVKMPINRETNTIGTIQINETNTKDYFSNTITSVRLTVFQNNNSEFTRNKYI